MMKPVRSLSALLAVSFLAAAVLPGLAEIPRKKPLTRYTQLWTKSAFTVPPEPPEVEVEEENPLDEYTLAGAGKLKGGWFVVLMHKKDRERIRLSPGKASEKGFEVVNVERGKSYMDTKVEIKTRSGKTGTVEYDKKFIVLRKATPKAPVKGAKPAARPTNGRPATPPVPGRSTKPSNARPPSPTKPRVRRIPSPPSR